MLRYGKSTCQFDLLEIVMSTTTWPLFTRAGMKLRALGRGRFPRVSKPAHGADGQQPFRYLITEELRVIQA